MTWTPCGWRIIDAQGGLHGEYDTYEEFTHGMATAPAGSAPQRCWGQGEQKQWVPTGWGNDGNPG